jgi:hypothetical protein
MTTALFALSGTLAGLGKISQLGLLEKLSVYYRSVRENGLIWFKGALGPFLKERHYAVFAF